MAHQCGDLRVVTISLWDRLRIHMLGLVLGMWVLCKRTLRWCWDPRVFEPVPRDNPPACLVDASLGQHKYVKLKGTKLHYFEAGYRNYPLLLLLHGFPDCWLSWRYQIPVLSTHFRVVAVDLKGFGDSEKPVWRSSYRIETLLEELKLLISALGVDSCTIIAHDLGALVSWYLVHQYPELVDRFVVVSCPHPNVYWKTLPSQSVFNSHWISFSQLPYLPEADALKEDLKIIGDSHTHLKQKDPRETYLEAYKYSFSRAADWTGPINYYRNLPFVRISERCEQIKVTTLLIEGEHDPCVKLEGVVRSTDYCERFILKMIESAGHYPHQENPDTFNREILKFLKVGATPTRLRDVENSKGIMNRMIGGVSSTMKYGYSVIDSVQKRTNGVVTSIPSIGLSLTQNSSISGN